MRERVRTHSFTTSHREFVLMWCDHCAFGTLAGRFTPAEIATFYPPDYYTHNPSTAPEGRATLLDRILFRVAWTRDSGRDFSPGELNRTKPRSLCDIGCGNGTALRLFSSFVPELCGVEPDPQARQQVGKEFAVFDGTAECLPEVVRAKRFDLVLMSHVLEHCLNPQAALGNVRSILSETGTAIIEVPNNAARGFEIFGARWPWTDIPRHVHFFTEASLRIAIVSAGLEVTNVFYTGYARLLHWSWRRDLPARDAWRLFALTVFADPSAKYDSIRIHARIRHPSATPA
jgi:SAM-dependent methyltransferase